MLEFNSWFINVLSNNNILWQKVDAKTIYVDSVNYSFKFIEIGENPGDIDGIFPVWEDWWLYKTDILKSKIRGKLGLLEKIPGRLCIVKRITKPVANRFLNENHLQDFTSSKIKLGLFLPRKYYRVLSEKHADDELLLGVMTFSGKRVFRDQSLSYEILRFATRKGLMIHGGFSKLFAQFIKEKSPDSVMTYADLDWYSGGFYEKLGFTVEGFKEGNYFSLDNDGKRIAEEDNFGVKNSGSLKMIWKNR